MKLGKREQAILEFLEEEPADEIMIELCFAPIRAKSKTHNDAPEYHKVRMTLSRMIAKGLIIKKGTTYEKILHKSTPNS